MTIIDWCNTSCCGAMCDSKKQKLLVSERRLLVTVRHPVDVIVIDKYIDVQHFKAIILHDAELN